MSAILTELQIRKIIKAMESNLNAFTRVQGEQENITVVKQMPKVENIKTIFNYYREIYFSFSMC